MNKQRFKCILSYNSDGESYARGVANLLRTHFRIDLEANSHVLSAGDHWATRVRRTVRTANALIFVGTEYALESRWVNAELTLVEQLGVPIIPIPVRFWNPIVPPPSLAHLDWVTEDHVDVASGPSIVLKNIIKSKIEALIQQNDKHSSRRFYYENTEKVQPLNEGKLILLGRGQVGKTSLVRRLSGQEFRQDEYKTQGINITKLQFTIKKRDIRINIWDFGG
jgi:hypothetical protein